ncbi:MAG: PAS domain S-box protein [Gemmatimonadota bacterium]
MANAALPPAPGTPRLRHVFLLLAIVVAADLVSMWILVLVLPGASEAVRELANGILLAAIAAPIFWFFVLRPMHRRALDDRARTENALRAAEAAEAQFRTIVETAQEGIWVVGPDGKTTYVSARMAEMLGHTPRGMLGRSFFDFMDEDGRAIARQMHGQGGIGLLGRHDVRFRRSNGADLWAVVTANILPGDGARPGGVLAMLTDITDRKGAEAEDQRLSQAFNEAADCVIVTDADGIILWVNDAFVRVTGYAKAEALGKTPRILKSEVQEADFYADLWRTIRSGEVYRGMLVNRRRNGEHYFIDQTITPIRNDAGRITHYVAAGREIAVGVMPQAEEAMG